MKLMSYQYKGQNEFGIARDDGIASLNVHFKGRFPDLRALLAAGEDELEKLNFEALSADRKFADVTFLPVITNPDKIVCIGLNYRAHAAEGNRALPQHPSTFLRLVNSMVGHEGKIIRPKASANLDFEGELAVIIGRGGRHITEADALKHVAGYSIFVDGSIRDYQKHSVTAGKNFIGTGPLGPWMVTADEIPDPTKLLLTTKLNGKEMQHSGTDLLVYSIPTLITYISKITELFPGDVIATGTPEGVGHRRDPQLWMKPGDLLEVEISKIGVLRNRIIDEV